MKTAIKKSLVLVALLFAATVSYGNEISGNTNDGKSSTTNVTFNNVKKGSILSIKDMNGLVLYKESIKEDGKYAKGFDLTSLPDGSYYFELNKEVEIKVVPFIVAASVVTFDKTTESRIFKPVVYFKDEKVYISKMSFEQEVLDVRILTEDGETIHTEKIEKEGNILGKVYDISKLENGRYTIVMKTKERRFVENIQI